MTEAVFQRIVQHGCPDVEEGLHRRPVPTHLLFFVHALGDDLVPRTLHERRRDRLTLPAPGGVRHQGSLVPLEVAQQLAHEVLQAPNASHAAYIGYAAPSGTKPRVCACIPANARATSAISPAPVREPPRRTSAYRPRQGLLPAATRVRNALRHAPSRARRWRSAATRAAAATTRHRRRSAPSP